MSISTFFGCLELGFILCLDQDNLLLILHHLEHIVVDCVLSACAGHDDIFVEGFLFSSEVADP